MKLSKQIATARRKVPVGSPCIDICKLDEHRTFCVGCLRTREEIKGWKTWDDSKKIAVLDTLEAREKAW